MKGRTKFLMFVFAFIVAAWAIGIAGLIIWQTSIRKPKRIINTQASYPTIIVTPTLSVSESYPTSATGAATPSSNSGFGGLLNR